MSKSDFLYRHRQAAYEAAYIANELNIFGEYQADAHIAAAAKRILALYKICSAKEATKFLKDNYCDAYNNAAKELNKRLHGKKKEFFSSLDEASLYLYHGANYEVSFDYGVSLAGVVNFDGKNIADIGGSSGGLSAGINSLSKHAEFTVYDTEYACMSGSNINNGNAPDIRIKFVKTDFFSGAFSRGYHDYYILSNILHDWDDKDCLKILKNTLSRLSEKSKLIIYEDILFENRIMPIEAIVHGLRLAVNVPGGRQRTAQEILSLAGLSDNRAKLLKFHNFGAHSAAIIGFLGEAQA